MWPFFCRQSFGMAGCHPRNGIMCVEDVETQGFLTPPTTALKTRASKGKIEFEAWLLWWKHVCFFPKNTGSTATRQQACRRLQERAWQESMKASGRCDIQRHFPETFPWMKPKHPTSKHPFIFFSIQAVTCENGWFAKKNRGKIAKIHPRVPEKPEKKHHFGGRNGWKDETLTFQLRSYESPYGILQNWKFYYPKPSFFSVQVRGSWLEMMVERHWNLFLSKACNMKSFNCCFGIERMVQRDA